MLAVVRACSALAALAVTFAHARADACTVLPEIRSVYPEDGATDVPTDIVPWLDANWRGVFAESGWARIVGPDGVAAPITVEILDRGSQMELRPRTPLAPRTEYRIEASLQGSAYTDGGMEPDFTSTFVTGDGPSTEIPSRPDVGRLETVDFGGGVGTCAPPAMACASYAGGDLAEVTVRDGSDVLFRRIQPAAAGIEIRPNPDGDFCLDVRERAPNGALSEPVTVCSADGTRFSFNPSSPPRELPTCFDGHVHFGAQPVSALRESHGGTGCSAAPSRAPLAPLGLLLLLPILRRARRRRPSS